MIRTKAKGYIYGIALSVLILVLMAANLWFGSINIPAGAVWNTLIGNEVEKTSWAFIIWESRLPQAVTALLCGAALAASGLMLQTAFNIRFLFRDTRCLHRVDGGNGTYPFLFDTDKKQHHAADYGYHDRLYHFVRYFIT